MGYWVYNHQGMGMKVFYTEKNAMRVRDFVAAINNGGYGVRAAANQVGQSSTVPRVSHGGQLHHIGANMVALLDVVERLSVEPEYLEKMEQKLEEKGTVDEILDVFVEMASEFGVKLSKDDIKEVTKAKADAEPLTGGIIAYSHYVIAG